MSVIIFSSVEPHRSAITDLIFNEFDFSIKILKLQVDNNRQAVRAIAG